MGWGVLGAGEGGWQTDAEFLDAPTVLPLVQVIVFPSPSEVPIRETVDQFEMVLRERLYATEQIPVGQSTVQDKYQVVAPCRAKGFDKRNNPLIDVDNRLSID